MRTRSTLAACVLAVAALVAGCTSTGDEEGLPIVTAGSVPEVTQGDTCDDGTADLLVDENDVGNTRSEPAGIDIVHASAEVTDAGLSIVFQTLGPIESAPDATFDLQHGDLIQSPERSWDIRIEQQAPGRWVAVVVTLPHVGRQQETTLAVTPVVEGNRLTLTVPPSSVPDLSSRLWSFGSSAGIAGENRTFDDCLPYAQNPSGTTTTSTASGSTTVTAPPVLGSVGETLSGSDGAMVTVHAVEAPAVPDPGVELKAVAGTQFVTADVEVCAGQGQLAEVGESRFFVALDNGDVRGIVTLPTSPHQPQFPVAVTLRPGACERGWVTFQVASDAAVASVSYDVSGSGVGPLLTFAT